MLQFSSEGSFELDKTKKDCYDMKKVDFSRKNMKKLKLNSIAGFKFTLLFKLKSF